MRSGVTAFPAHPSCAYDAIADVDGKPVRVRCGLKTSKKPSQFKSFDVLCIVDGESSGVRFQNKNGIYHETIKAAIFDSSEKPKLRLIAPKKDVKKKAEFQLDMFGDF